VALAVAPVPVSRAAVQERRVVAIRGHEQTLYLYGPSDGYPVLISSGDGGWVHLAPHVADFLGAHGFFVAGFDVKAYLTSFTSGRTTLEPADEPRDFKVLVDTLFRGATRKPILVGVSEGAGLSVLAATDPATRSELAGVMALGLPDLNELGWRWKDAVIYVTHRVPNEPTFSVASVIGRVAPLPLAMVHATHDEFVPIDEAQRLFGQAREPKRLWVVDASNHRFSDKLEDLDRTLLEAVAWLQDRAAH
jgi:virulence protein VirJ